MGVQQNRGADLRQLAHPRPSQLKDVQRLQDPPRLHPPDLLLGGGTALRQDTRPPAARRTFRSPRSPSQLCKGLGVEIQPTKRGLLPMLARSAPQTSGEMRIIAPPPPTGLFHSELFYLRLNFWLSPFVIAGHNVRGAERRRRNYIFVSRRNLDVLQCSLGTM